MRLLEDNPFFEKKLLMGSKVAILHCKMAKVANKNRNTSPDYSLSSIDTHTPDELRIIPHLGRPIRRPSRLPVMKKKHSEEGKEVADGCILRTAQENFKRIAATMKKFMVDDSPAPTPPPRRTSYVARKAWKPTLKPRAAAPPPKKAPRTHIQAEAPKVPVPPKKAAPPSRKGPHRGTKLSPQRAVPQQYMEPLAHPEEGLSSFFQNIGSNEWKKKLLGLKTIQAIAQNHQELLTKIKLHEVCIVLAEQVNNLRSVVACAAMDALADLHSYLGKMMDPEVERTGGALLLKLAQTTNAFILQQAHLALDVLVKGSSPGRVMNVLLNIGSNHRCHAVRACTALHLEQLLYIIGEDEIFASGKIISERLLIAVSKMAVDAASEVRLHGQSMLLVLSRQEEFSVLWHNIIPMKDRHPLQKILQKMRQ
ncbi:TOG array regulator of axonemal microtubules protein 2-like [Gymnodraco acuticeps]|uniref:TOG array regulator of axonemal microtubules protein 2-like n=1 Tax=Gymnodraco acuticeps TaxID=8218 RepID=A0A6P8X9D6_GYMAC|nr:TOG array regulator of axonemal microtubules protein 2-like [Gymnodraco acuticeps]